ncbi:uncharacterized protein [Pyxicephalus adspersus]|uniref:uncharacterized protein n=1 Tax=Pyxicephalus adspersus TaxID=30357 RepID=UPI003B59FB95
MDFRYKIKKRLFSRGHDYTIKIRSKPENEGYKGIWSEWSPAVEWHNDYSLSAYEIIKNTMIATVPVLIIFIILGFVCVSLWKKKWRNNIQDPSRSHLAMTMVHRSQVTGLRSDVECNISWFERKYKKTICGKWLKKWFSRNQDITHRNPETPKTTGYVNCIDPNKVNNVLVPEVTAVERFINLSPLVVNMDLENMENSFEENSEVQLLECDLINRMLFEILKADDQQEELMELPGIKETENTNDSLSFGDEQETSIGYEEDQFINPPSILTKRYLPPDSQSEDFIDQKSIFCVETPASMLVLDSSCLENDCIDNFQQKAETCMLPSDTMCNKLQKVLKPNSDCLESTNLNKPTKSSSEICHADLSMSYGYRPFDDVVHQEKNLVMEEGYKPFECLTNHSGNDSCVSEFYTKKLMIP